MNKVEILKKDLIYEVKHGEFVFSVMIHEKGDARTLHMLSLMRGGQFLTDIVLYDLINKDGLLDAINAACEFVRELISGEKVYRENYIGSTAIDPILMKKRLCKFCAKSFQPTTVNQSFCSADCLKNSIDAINGRIDIKTIPVRKFKEKPCRNFEICGNKFTPVSPGDVYCAECKGGRIVSEMESFENE